MINSNEITIKRKIGNTEYIVKAQYATAASENAAKKVRRLILMDFINNKDVQK